MKSSVAALAAVLTLSLVGCSHDTASSSVARNAVKQSANLHGPSRVPVKHGLDPDAASIDLAPKATTVEGLVAQKAPKDIAGGAYESKRVGPFEKSVWRVDAKVKSVVLRKDGDFYMVIEGPSGRQSVVEVPDPKLCKGSPLEGKIAAARADIEKRFHPTTDPKDVGRDATIEGVGFFGGRGPSGKGPSGGGRLMPGLAFDWK